MQYRVVVPIIIAFKFTSTAYRTRFCFILPYLSDTMCDSASFGGVGGLVSDYPLAQEADCSWIGDEVYNSFVNVPFTLLSTLYRCTQIANSLIHLNSMTLYQKFALM